MSRTSCLLRERTGLAVVNWSQKLGCPGAACRARGPQLAARGCLSVWLRAVRPLLQSRTSGGPSQPPHAGRSSRETLSRASAAARPHIGAIHPETQPPLQGSGGEQWRPYSCQAVLQKGIKRPGGKQSSPFPAVRNWHLEDLRAPRLSHECRGITQKWVSSPPPRLSYLHDQQRLPNSHQMVRLARQHETPTQRCKTGGKQSL